VVFSQGVAQKLGISRRVIATILAKQRGEPLLRLRPLGEGFSVLHQVCLRYSLYMKPHPRHHSRLRRSLLMTPSPSCTLASPRMQTEDSRKTLTLKLVFDPVSAPSEGKTTWVSQPGGALHQSSVKPGSSAAHGASVDAFERSILLQPQYAALLSKFGCDASSLLLSFERSILLQPHYAAPLSKFGCDKGYAFDVGVWDFFHHSSGHSLSRRAKPSRYDSPLFVFHRSGWMETHPPAVHGAVRHERWQRNLQRHRCSAATKSLVRHTSLLCFPASPAYSVRAMVSSALASTVSAERRG
jgi:hypothetical protein